MEIKNVFSKIANNKIWRKKSFWIILAVIIVVVAIGSFFLSSKARMNKMEKALASAAQTTTVTRGNISNTVEGSGSLEAAEIVDVQTFEGLEVNKVFVESGDSIKKGQKLVSVRKSSVTKQLVEVQSAIEDIEDDLNATGLTSLEREVLKEERTALKKTEKKLTRLRNNTIIKSKIAGIVGSVNVDSNSEVSNGGASAGNNSAASVQLTSAKPGNTKSGLNITLLSTSTSAPEETTIPSVEKEDEQDKTDDKTNANINKSAQTIKKSQPSVSTVNQETASLSNAGSSNNAGSSSDNASSSNTASGDYSIDTVTIMEIYKTNSVKVSVSVDELDILDVKKDQNATVTLDALEGEEHEGTVTKVASSATVGNGSTKYDVEITIPMSKNMRIGMSATASIKISEAENVLIIPMTALQQRGEQTFVYTSQDSDGNLTSEVIVETGLSDGENVEIISGLEEGSTVCYIRTGSSESNSDAFQGGGMKPGGGMMPGGFGGGDMPDRGNRGSGENGNFPNRGGERPSKN